jgi:hypothetical protein
MIGKTVVVDSALEGGQKFEEEPLHSGYNEIGEGFG